jgi:hypothetical protein
MRWLMCLGLSLYFLVTTVSGMAFGAPRGWLFVWALPCTLVPLVIGALVGVFSLSNGRLTAGLLVCVAWMVLFSLGLRQRERSSTKVDKGEVST